MKKTVCFAIIVTALLVLFGCQPTPETPPVVSKNDGKLENSISKGAPEGYLYEAPQSYTLNDEYCGDILHVRTSGDTVINAPKGVAFPVYEAHSANFSADMVSSLIKCCFGDAKLSEHVTQLTKSQIQNDIILPMKQTIFNIQNGDWDPAEWGRSDVTNEYVTAEQAIHNLEEAIKYQEAQMALASDSITLTPVTIEDYVEGRVFDVDAQMGNGKLGRAYIDNNVLSINMNYIKPDESSFDSQTEQEAGIWGDCCLVDNYYLECAERDGLTLPKISADYAKNAAIEFWNKTGITGYTFTDIGADLIMNRSSYAVVFMRELENGLSVIGDDQSVRMGSATGYELGSDKQYSDPFTYERVIVWVNSGGVWGIYMTGHLEVTSKLCDSVELVDFDTCVKNLSARIKRDETTYFADTDDDGMCDTRVDSAKYAEYVLNTDICLTKFDLGYAQVKEKNKNGYFLLIPVWYVSQSKSEQYYYGENQTDLRNDSYSSYRSHVINAIDGSVIDRELGY